MQMVAPLKARVRNGRLVLDEPTDLPEGTEVELVRVEESDPLLRSLANAPYDDEPTTPEEDAGAEEARQV